MSQTPAFKPIVRLASKTRPHKPNHNLFNNNGIWWCQITVHRGPFSKRLRFSLKTADIALARERRDRIFASLAPRSRAA